MSETCPAPRPEPSAGARPRALVVDPRGADAAVVSRALGPEFAIRLAPDAGPAQIEPFALALVVADHDSASARAILAELARRRPEAARIAVAPAADADIFGLEAAGAEHVVTRPLLETALRLAARSAHRLHEARRTLEALRADLARAAAIESEVPRVVG